MLFTVPLNGATVVFAVVERGYAGLLIWDFFYFSVKYVHVLFMKPITNLLLTVVPYTTVIHRLVRTVLRRVTC